MQFYSLGHLVLVELSNLTLLWIHYDNKFFHPQFYILSMGIVRALSEIDLTNTISITVVNLPFNTSAAVLSSSGLSHKLCFVKLL